MAARPLVARQPNERLQALIQEAGCSNAGLARRVNMCGAEHGLDLRYDKTSVARWLRGQQPRGRAPAIIAERSEEHTSELQSQFHLVCRLLLEKKKNTDRSSLNFTTQEQRKVTVYVPIFLPDMQSRDTPDNGHAHPQVPLNPDFNEHATDNLAH